MRGLVRAAAIAALATVLCGLASGSAIAATANFGALAPAYSGSGVGCGGCGIFQVTSSGPSYQAPKSGVITAFRMRIGDAPLNTETVAPVVVRALGSGQYKVVARMAAQNLFGVTPQSILEIPANIPVQEGDHIGNEYWTSNVAGAWPNNSGFTSADFSRSTDSTAVDTPFTPSIPINTSRLNLEAVLEYTDPPAASPADTTPPTIAALKSKNARFRVAAKGAVIAKAPPKGTVFNFTLSEIATVRFTVLKAVKQDGKTIWRKITTFTRLQTAGPGSLRFSGRYRRAGQRGKSLAAGRYRLSAIATDAAGNSAAAPAVAGFTILR